MATRLMPFSALAALHTWVFRYRTSSASDYHRACPPSEIVATILVDLRDMTVQAVVGDVDCVAYKTTWRMAPRPVQHLGEWR